MIWHKIKIILIIYVYQIIWLKASVQWNLSFQIEHTVIVHIAHAGMTNELSLEDMRYDCGHLIISNQRKRVSCLFPSLYCKRFPHV